MLSSVESKKVSGKCYNTEGKVLTTVVFPEAGGPRTQTLGAMEQGYANVKMQNSKNPNQFPHSCIASYQWSHHETIISAGKLPEWRLQDWAPLGKIKGNSKSVPAGSSFNLRGQ